MNPSLSLTPVPGAWAEPVNSRTALLVDYEAGAETLGTASDSTEYVWRAFSEGDDIQIDREGVPPVVVLVAPDITEVSLAFDSAMNPHVAYVSSGVAYWRYWDTLTGAYATLTLAGARSPRCCSDEKTPEFSSDRDVIVTYLRGADLYVRLQRDRFTLEYVKVPEPVTHEPITATSRIITFGMITGRRLQWRFQ